MSKAKTPQERRRIRFEQERRKKLEQEQLEEKELEVADDLEDVGIEEADKELLLDEAEQAEKCGDGMVSMARATSWEEHEELKYAAEKAHELREVSWTVSDLVYNILASPEMDPTQKAQAIQEVGAGFEERALGIMAEDSDEEGTEKDLDLLTIEAIQSYDKRHAGFLENLGDVAKAVLNAKRENALTDAQFGLVRDENGKKVRKYPIHDKAHVRNALARAAQMINRGGMAAKDAKAALPKIRSAARRMGIEVSKENNSSGIIVEKDAKGDWRWVGWPSNQYIDYDGDIFGEAAHKEYVEWLDKNMDVSPVFITWHTAGTHRQSPVDFAAYENGFLIMSGKLTEKEAAALLEAQTITDLGMSHGTLVLARDPNDTRIVTKYRMYEVSDLPLDRAANPFTALETVAKEANMDKLKYLAAILGSEDKAKAYLDKAGLMKKELDQVGVESKEQEAPAQAEQPSAPAPAVTPDEEIVKKVSEKLDIPGLNAWVAKANEALEKVETLEALIKELSASKEEKVAEMLTPPAERLAWSMKARASQSPETVLKDDDDLKKAKPGVPADYWLSQATGTTPIEVSQ